MFGFSGASGVVMGSDGRLVMSISLFIGLPPERGKLNVRLELLLIIERMSYFNFSCVVSRYQSRVASIMAAAKGSFTFDCC